MHTDGRSTSDRAAHIFVSTALWATTGDRLRAVAPDLVPLLYVPGERVPADVLDRADLACLSSDLWPDWAGRYLRICLDAPRLRWLHTFSAGVDAPIFRTFLDRGVRLTTSSGSSARPIAHHVVMCLLAAARDLPGLLRDQAAHRWLTRDVVDVEGRTVGIIGMGPIGTEVARLAAELGMRPVGLRRTVTGDEPCETWTFDRLGDLLDVADDLVLAVPLTRDTEQLIGSAELARLRPGATLVNVGRGRLLDQQALEAALVSGHLGFAALDVTEPEPLPDESALWDLQNVMITPHLSGATASAERRAADLLVDNLGRFLRGEPLRNEVR